MKKTYRLADRKVFKTIIRNKKIYSKKYLIYFQKNEANYLRVAISVSKSNFKLAVTRNRIKRQIRSFFNKLPDKNVSLDFLIIVNKNYLKDDYNKNCADFMMLFNKIVKPKTDN